MAAHDAIWRHPEYRRGVTDMVGVALGIGAWGLVTGVAMAKSGLGVPLAVLMSLVVYAGTAQLAVLPLIASGAPLWVIWATAFCINLRFVIFSAQWRPYFSVYGRWKRLHLAYFTGDLNYVLFMRRFPDPRPSPEQVPYFWGGACINWTAWQVTSIAGILLGESVPEAWGIGFAGTMALLGLTCSLLAGPATWLAAGVAACAAVAAYAMPLKLNIVVAIAAALAVCLTLDRVRPAAPPGGSA